MNEKKRSDITLGEIQDACKRNDANACGGCECRDACWSNNFNLTDKPKDWDLSDPPRFNEAQMALLRIMNDMGAEYATQRNGSIGFYTGAPMRRVAVVDIRLFDDGKTEYLAELLGKDAT